MVKFKAIIKRFDRNAEKTGWSYIQVPLTVAQKLKPGNKKSFRVKGRLDDYVFDGMALLPMGEGDFILALNATVRKKIRKEKGASLNVEMECDDKPVQPPPELMECLKDDPQAQASFSELAKSHQNYFINYIKTAKTDATKTKRLAQTVTALARGMNYGEMIRKLKQDKNDIGNNFF